MTKQQLEVIATKSSNGSAARLGVTGRAAKEKVDRLLLEWCCGGQSLLGMPSADAEDAMLSD